MTVDNRAYCLTGRLVRHYLWWLILATVIAAIHFSGLNGLLAYKRDLIEQGQVWRLVTAHLAHLSAGHMMENMSGVIVVAWLCGTRLTFVQWSGVLLFLSLAVSAALYLIDSGIGWYVGLSGVLYGLLFAGLLSWPSQEGATLWPRVVLVAVALKIVVEQMMGPLPASVVMTGGAVIVQAHLYGAVAGVLVALLLRWKSDRAARRIHEPA